MTDKIRDRILRPATPEEKARHEQIRRQTEEELPELKRWAREAAARQKSRVRVGTVFEPQEAHVVEAIDIYAAAHGLEDRGAVVRMALAHLLDMEIAPQQSSQG